ncbi:hypothetical protein MAR_010229 [Mya arenaria]|uniref:Uncharacterized protein n=1 Tax=Mya arenaria TaxID=6604 RepID=A0ABY7E936_MYAAR|nr:hypothetical protein MAR_010229 [Mya arenaria]
MMMLTKNVLVFSSIYVRPLVVAIMDVLTFMSKVIIRGNRPDAPGGGADARDQALIEKEKQLRQMQEMVAKMQAEMEAQKGGQQNGVRSHNDTK